MAMGRFAKTSGSITTNTTTTLVTAATGETIYVFWLGIDVSVAGTTSTALVKAATTAQTLGLYATTAVGHQESYTATGLPQFAGFQVAPGENLVVTTAGGAAATLTVTVFYEVRGGAF